MLKHLRLQRPLAFLDVESTGVNPQTDRIVEIAVLRCSPDEKPVSFHRLVNPGMPIPPSTTAIHGIKDADVADCLSFATIAPKLTRFLNGCDLAGFGIKRFDLPLLVAEFRRAGILFPLAGRAVVDVLQIFHQREKRDLQAAVAFYCGESHEQAHRADHDVHATVKVLDEQLHLYRDLPRTISQLHAELTEVDVAGWFRRQDDTIVLGVGKYTGHALTEVIEQYPDYIRWLLAQPLLNDTRSIITSAFT